MTALMTASWCYDDRLEVVELLLERGAIVDLINEVCDCCSLQRLWCDHMTMLFSERQIVRLRNKILEVVTIFHACTTGYSQIRTCSCCSYVYIYFRMGVNREGLNASVSWRIFTVKSSSRLSCLYSYRITGTRWSSPATVTISKSCANCWKRALRFTSEHVL